MHRPTSSGSGGLSRFGSAPAGPWLESLLEGDESESNQNFTQLLVGPLATASTSPSAGQNTSPVDFLGAATDGFFSGFGFSSTDVSFSLNGGRSGQVHGAESGMIDLDIENLLEDAVPRRVRAKRGFATHPRSIAERVRRTRISDRIRKLQELVPNMDKQTNTADMLDEAVEYVKTLQKQIQELLEHQKECTCVSKK